MNLCLDHAALPLISLSLRDGCHPGRAQSARGLIQTPSEGTHKQTQLFVQ
jgi:hypothetical protein